MPPVGFQATITGGEQLYTYTLDCVATGTGLTLHVLSESLLKLPPSESESFTISLILSDKHFFVKHFLN
jgi:hypothetical protein